jgi:uncharacterized protein YidB (DUF937 family)
MGFLDDLLGQLAGGRADAEGSTGNTGKVMMALLPVVLGMLTSGQRERSGGGLGDILGQVLGGTARGSGGLGELLEQFQRAGYGDQARSWVGTGRNQPMPADGFEKVFGRSGLTEIARRAGVSEQDASRGLAQLMPEMIDHVTPNGQVPDASSLLASVDSVARRFGVA